MRRPVVISAVAGGVLAALLLAGCTSSGGGSAGSNAAANGGATGFSDAVAPAAPPAGAIPAASSAVVGSGESASGPESAKLIADSRSVIRTAELTVGVKNASDVIVEANKAEALVTARGGEVFGDDRDDGTAEVTPDADRQASATLTLKVPPAQLTATLTALSQLGTEESRSLTSQDVTTQVADVNARVQSAAASIARLRTLYGSAAKVSDVIAIESELSQREADLESLQAQQRALSTETELATVTLVLTTVKPPVVKVVQHHHHAHYTGIGGAFANGWHHFVATGAWIARAFATVVTFALVIALLVAAGLWLHRRRPAPAPTPVPLVE